MNVDITNSIKDLVLSGSDEIVLIRLMAQSLKEEELEGLIKDLKEDGCKDDVVFMALNEEYDKIAFVNKCKREHDAKTFKRNESASLLLKWYSDKKSGKVIYARDKLHERFSNLSCSEQISAIRLFLNGGKTDREWCYNTLRKWWAKELESDITKVWDQYHEERCGWLFPKYMPVDIIREHIESLCYNSNYYQLCKRLAPEPWFKIDKVRLRNLTEDYKYLWIMSQAPNGLTPDEALELVFRWIAVAIHYFDTETDPDDSHFIGRGNTDFIVKLSSEHLYDNFYMHKLIKMDKMLSSMCKMGFHEDVRQFLKFDMQIHNDFINIYQMDLDSFSTLGGYTKDSNLESLFSSFAQYYAKNFPSKYERQLYYWKNIDNNSYEYNGRIHSLPIVSDPEPDYNNGSGNTIQMATLYEMPKESIQIHSNNNPALKELIDKFDLEPVIDEPPF